MISNIRHVMNVVFFLLGDSPSFEVYLPTFQNTLFNLHRRCKQEEGTDRCSETLANKIQMSEKHPKKEYNKTVFVLSFMCVAILLSSKGKRSK